MVFQAAERAISGARKSAIRSRMTPPQDPGFLKAEIVWRGLLSASGNGRVQETCQKSAPTGDAAVLDVKNVTRYADLSERRRVRAGQPDLRAELCELAEQRGAPGGIEMGDHLVE